MSDSLTKDSLTKEVEKVYDEAEHSPLGRDEYINTLLCCLLKENIEIRKAYCDMKGMLEKTVQELKRENKELKDKLDVHEFGRKAFEDS